MKYLNGSEETAGKILKAFGLKGHVKKIVFTLEGLEAAEVEVTYNVLNKEGLDFIESIKKYKLVEDEGKSNVD